MTRENFDKKYFTAKSQRDKNEAYIEYVFSLEAQLKARDEILDKLHKAYAEADYECKALDAKLAKKDEKIEKLKEQYHQCLDDYKKCAERKEQQ